MDVIEKDIVIVGPGGFTELFTVGETVYINFLFSQKITLFTFFKLFNALYKYTEMK